MCPTPVKPPPCTEPCTEPCTRLNHTALIAARFPTNATLVFAHFSKKKFRGWNTALASNLPAAVAVRPFRLKSVRSCLDIPSRVLHILSRRVRCHLAVPVRLAKPSPEHRRPLCLSTGVALIPPLSVSGRYLKPLLQTPCPPSHTQTHTG